MTERDRSLSRGRPKSRAAEWKTPLDIKRRYPKASIIGNQQVVFNICGNDYRLWVTVAYQTGIVMVREIGTR